MTLNELCQNCFRDINKPAAQSNFCSQECFDEWIVKQHNRVIKAFDILLFPEVEGKEEKKHGLPLVGRIN